MVSHVKFYDTVHHLTSLIILPCIYLEQTVFFKYCGDNRNHWDEKVEAEIMYIAQNQRKIREFISRGDQMLTLIRTARSVHIWSCICDSFRSCH